MADLDPVKITGLNEASSVATGTDFLVVAKISDAYQSGAQTVKVHPDTLLAYNNKRSKLNARNYQDAIDEIVNLMTVGQTFNAPLAPNPNANEITVYTEDISNGGQ